MYCTRCGRAGGEGDRFCAACGAELPAAAVPPAAPAAVPFEPAPVTELVGEGSAPAEAPPAIPPAAEPQPADAERAAEPAPAWTAPEPAMPAAPIASMPHFAYAGFWRRFTALLVDGAVLFFPQAIVRVAFGLSPLAFGDDWTDPTVITAEWVGMGVALAYVTLLECSRAQGTLGQQLLGLRVTDTRGRRIGFGRALGRQFAKVLSVLTCGFGYLLQLWNGKRQTLHDMLCGVLVLRADESPVAEAPGVRVLS